MVGDNPCRLDVWESLWLKHALPRTPDESSRCSFPKPKIVQSSYYNYLPAYSKNTHMH